MPIGVPKVAYRVPGSQQADWYVFKRDLIFLANHHVPKPILTFICSLFFSFFVSVCTIMCDLRCDILRRIQGRYLQPIIP
jgi:hypothetical protein